MFPFPVILAGCREPDLQPVRQQLQSHGIGIEAVFRTTEEVVAKQEFLREGLRLFVTHLQTEQELHATRRLNAAFPGYPIVALMDDGDNASCLLVAMRAGVCQVVPLPLEATDFKDALDSIARQHQRHNSLGRVVAVSGVAGGCGATTLAINLAYEIANGHRERTILAELSLQMGMIVTYLDFESQFGLDDLLSCNQHMDARMIEQSLTRVSDMLSILPGPRRPVPLSSVGQGKIANILDYLKHMAEVVVLDVPCTFDDAYFDLLRSAEQVVLVGEQRIPAIRNIQLVLDTLGRQDSGQKLHMVINRYDRKIQGFTAAELAKLLHLPFVLTVVNDPTQVSAALNQGLPLREAAPNSPVLADVKTLTRSLFDVKEVVPASATRSGVFGRLFQAVGLSSGAKR